MLLGIVHDTEIQNRILEVNKRLKIDNDHVVEQEEEKEVKGGWLELLSSSVEMTSDTALSVAAKNFMQRKGE